MIEERYELAVERIRVMQSENTVPEKYRDYFHQMAAFVQMIDELRTQLLKGSYQQADQKELAAWNERLYRDILGEAYETSYANPAYAVRMLGEGYGQILSFLYTELRGAIVYTFEGKTEYLDILFELLIEVYNQFEGEKVPEESAVRDTVYWYASDYCDVFTADRIRAVGSFGILRS